MRALGSSAARLLLGALVGLALALPAEARWLRAETDKFVVYGDGTERAIREFATKLDTYDKVLRAFNPATRNRTPGTKLQVVLLKSAESLKRIQPALPKYAAGFYIAMNEGVFAFALREGGLGDDDALFHEYAHHFMLENFPTAYPAWFVEGWAEYFMTAEINGATVKVGGYNPARAYGIFNETWLPLDQLMSSTTAETRQDRRSAYYAQAWLLMHYMRSDPARAAQLDQATRAIAAGEPPVKAFQDATGLTMEQLTQALKRYNKLPAYTVTLKDASPPFMTVAAMPASTDELFLDNLHLILSPTGRVEPEFLAAVRRKAARFPGDWFAERTLARAEFVMGDVAAGEAIQKRRLAAKPDDVEDLLLAGTGQLMAGVRESTEREARYRAARPLLTKAYQLDKGDFRTLYAYALSRSIEPTFPTDNDLNALLEARGLAPAVTELSARAGAALWQKGRRQEATKMLTAVINNPHGGRSAAQMREFLKTGVIGAVETDAPGEAQEEGSAAPAN